MRLRLLLLMVIGSPHLKEFMRLTRRQIVSVAAGTIAIAMLPRRARAQGYPWRPVRLVVGLAAGGATDLVARLIGEWLSNHLSQQFIVENRVGAGGTIAASAVISSPSDGYTILLLGSNHAIGATLYKNLPYVLLRDVTPIAGLMQTANVMVVPPSMPVKTVAEFIDYAKANPGKLSYASGGSGTTVHLSAELFKRLAGLNVVHVPYRGMASAYPDLFNGQVQLAFDNLPGVIEFIRTGRLRALAVTTAARSPALPDVPTVSETVKGFEANVWFGIAGPRGMPAEAVETLNRSINAAFSDSRITARVAELGAVPMPMSPPQFGRLIADEIEKWAEVVKFSGAVAE